MRSVYNYPEKQETYPTKIVSRLEGICLTPIEPQTRRHLESKRNLCSLLHHRSETLVSDDSPVNTNTQWFQPWFPSGAGFRPSTVWSATELQRSPHLS